MNKSLVVKFVGIVCFIVGVILLLANVRVAGMGFFTFNKGGIILLLMGIDFILMVWRPEKIFDYIMMILSIILIFMIMKNVRVYLVGMSLLKYVAIAICLFGGIGLILKSKSIRK